MLSSIRCRLARNHPEVLTSKIRLLDVYTFAGQGENTFNTQALLGRSLLAQEKASVDKTEQARLLAEAKSKLVAGCEGMKHHEASIPLTRRCEVESLPPWLSKPWTAKFQSSFRPPKKSQSTFVLNGLAKKNGSRESGLAFVPQQGVLPPNRSQFG